jgi:hypothetical protein
MDIVKKGQMLDEIKAMVELLISQRSSAAIEGLEGDNTIIEIGEIALAKLEKLVMDY